MSLVLERKVGGDFKPHPEGIHPAVCVDVIDLGLCESEFQGRRRLLNKVRLVFESEQRTDDGRNCTVTKTFTASLHRKAKLAQFLGQWRGRPVVPGESIDLARLIGANATLVISHQLSSEGRTHASIDAVSKPTKRLTPSGHYDPARARQRLAEWKARERGGAVGDAETRRRGDAERGGGVRSAECGLENGSAAAGSGEGAAGAEGGAAKSGAGTPQPTPAQAVQPSALNPQPSTGFDPEVGF